MYERRVLYVHAFSCTRHYRKSVDGNLHPRKKNCYCMSIKIYYSINYKNDCAWMVLFENLMFNLVCLENSLYFLRVYVFSTSWIRIIKKYNWFKKQKSLYSVNYYTFDILVYYNRVNVKKTFNTRICGT